METLCAAVVLSASLGCSAQEIPPPIIDMHLHAFPWEA